MLGRPAAPHAHRQGETGLQTLSSRRKPGSTRGSERRVDPGFRRDPRWGCGAAFISVTRSRALSATHGQGVDARHSKVVRLEAGGLGLYSTVGESMKFIRMFLNDGAGPNGRVLEAETVEQMCEDGLAKLGLASGGSPGATSAPTSMMGRVLITRACSPRH